jgi:hypothetical protein
MNSRALLTRSTSYVGIGNLSLHGAGNEYAFIPEVPIHLYRYNEGRYGDPKSKRRMESMPKAIRRVYHVGFLAVYHTRTF